MKWWTSRERTRRQLQRQLDAEKSEKERNRLGQFATPFPLARQIVSVAQDYQPLPIKEIRLLEPAVGSGVFYSAYLHTTEGTSPEAALGFEVDRQLAKIAGELWGKAGLRVRNEDFTLAFPPPDEGQRFNILITNPPYVRHHHLTQTQKRRLVEHVSRRFALKPSGLMGLYGYFLFLAHDWMQQNGIGAWLIPTEFMDVHYGVVLKEYLSSRVELLRLHRFKASDVKFSDADVTSSVLFLRNKAPAMGHEAVFSTGEDLKNPQSEVSVPVRDLRDIRKWTSIGRRPLHRLSRIGQQYNQQVTIGDLFDVTRGLVTGANDFFIMTRAEAEQRGLPPTFLRPILPSPRYLRRQAIVESDPSGFPLVEPALVLLDCDVPRERLAKRYPKLYQYISEGEAKELHRRYLLSRRAPWYRQEKRAPAPILCGYMARRGEDGKSIRFYRNKSRAVTSNVYLMLYPKSKLVQRCAEPEALFDRIFDLLTALDQNEVTRHGRTYGGGLDKIEPRELQRVTLSGVSDVEELMDFTS